MTQRMRRCRKIIRVIAIVLITGTLAGAYFIIIMVSANVDEDASNHWALAFCFSFVVDLCTMQVLKGLINAIIILYAIAREKRGNSKVKWAYAVVSSSVMNRMRIVSKTLMNGRVRTSY